MSLVVDASLALSWFYEDEQTPDRLAVLDRVVAEGAVVPHLWRLEIANALTIGVRRGRIDASFLQAAAMHLEVLPVRVDLEAPQHLWSRTVFLAGRNRLTVYDAVYLELVLRLRLPIASLDVALGNACIAEGASVVPLGDKPLASPAPLPT